MNYKFLSHKLRCYRGISGPEKSRSNTREKISYFFTCVDIANQLLTSHESFFENVAIRDKHQRARKDGGKMFSYVGLTSVY